MFTGIVQALGHVEELKGARLTLRAPLDAVKIGDSMAVEGVCLTVARLDGGRLGFDVSEETYSRTTLGTLKAGDTVNLEPAIRAGDPLGGHFVLGHVDAMGTILDVRPQAASTLYAFQIPLRLRKYLVFKGSVAIDGVSLTVAEMADDGFAAAVIPHTKTNTTLGRKMKGDPVNVEMDILAKHTESLLKSSLAEPSDNLFEKKEITWKELRRLEGEPS